MIVSFRQIFLSLFVSIICMLKLKKTETYQVRNETMKHLQSHHGLSFPITNEINYKVSPFKGQAFKSAEYNYASWINDSLLNIFFIAIMTTAVLSTLQKNNCSFNVLYEHLSRTMSNLSRNLAKNIT